MLVIADSFRDALDILYVWCFLFGKEIFMKLSNGTEVVTQPYREENAKEIVKLIHRNFSHHFCAAGISWAGDRQLYH